MEEIYIDGDYIRLDQLLKYVNIASTGGEAKIRIQEGEIKLNNEIVTQRGKKVKDGDIIEFQDLKFKILSK